MGKNLAFFVPAARGRFCALWGAALLLAALFASSVFGQGRLGGSPLDTLGEEVNQADGLKILQTFRSLGIGGQYRLSFQLKIKPRGEATQSVNGVLLGSQGEFGPISRVDVVLKESGITDQAQLEPAVVQRLLLQNGLFANAVALRSDAGAAVAAQVVAPSRYLDPIAGSDFTVFDLLMPFMFWQRFEYEGRTTMGSRPVHVFTLYPPEDDAGLRERISRVRLFLDEETAAMQRVMIYDETDELAREIRPGAIKIRDGRGVPSVIRVLNRKTRGSTTLRVTDFALDLEIPDWVFSLEGLANPVHGTELSRLK